jgi:hypothetical protein
MNLNFTAARRELRTRPLTRVSSHGEERIFRQADYPRINLRHGVDAYPFITRSDPRCASLVAAPFRVHLDHRLAAAFHRRDIATQPILGALPAALLPSVSSPSVTSFPA